MPIRSWANKCPRIVAHKLAWTLVVHITIIEVPCVHPFALCLEGQLFLIISVGDSPRLCQHGRGEMRDARFSSSSIDVHKHTKLDAFLRQMALRGAFTIIFTLTFCGRQVSKTLLERVSGVFAQLLSTKYVRGAENCRRFQRI